jgi:guanylate kinase
MFIVVSGPSGVGKGTVIKELLKQLPQLNLPVSYTTRPPRTGEKNGQDYYFVSEEEFAKTDFLEWAEVHGNKYGTPALNYTGDVLFEVDVQGAESIKTKCPDCLTIFLLPPSEAELEKRLTKRKTEQPLDVKRRLQTAKKEAKKRWEADYLIVNDVLSDTVAKLIEIIKLEQEKKKG